MAQSKFRPNRAPGEIVPGVREEARHRAFMGKWARVATGLTTLRVADVKTMLEAGRVELGIREDSPDPYRGLSFKDALRMDAPTTSQTVQRFMEPITIEYQRQTNQADAESRAAVTETEDIANDRNEKAVKRNVALNVAADASIPDLAAPFLISKEQGISNATIKRWINRNISLIKIDGGGRVPPIPREHFAKVRRILDLGIRRNTNHVDVARQLAGQNGITKRRARTIAIDQINKHNSSMTRTRHAQMGIKTYFWNHQGDLKVRDEHLERGGVEFEYAKPPPDGNPGEPVRCRCWPNPNIRRAIGLNTEPQRLDPTRTGDPAQNAISLARGKLEGAKRTARATKRGAKEADRVAAAAKRGTRTAANESARKAGQLARRAERAQVRANLALGELIE